MPGGYQRPMAAPACYDARTPLYRRQEAHHKVGHNVIQRCKFATRHSLPGIANRSKSARTSIVRDARRLARPMPVKPTRSPKSSPWFTVTSSPVQIDRRPRFD